MAKRSDGVILGGFTEAEAIVLAFQVSGMVKFIEEPVK